MFTIFNVGLAVVVLLLLTALVLAVTQPTLVRRHKRLPGAFVPIAALAFGVTVIADNVASTSEHTRATTATVETWEALLGDRIAAPNPTHWASPATWTFNLNKRTCFVSGAKPDSVINRWDDELVLVCRADGDKYEPVARYTIRR